MSEFNIDLAACDQRARVEELATVARLIFFQRDRYNRLRKAIALHALREGGCPVQGVDHVYDPITNKLSRKDAPGEVVPVPYVTGD